LLVAEGLQLSIKDFAVLAYSRFKSKTFFNFRVPVLSLLCGAALALTTLPAAADPVNLVQNGSFNTVAGWNPAASGSAATSSNLPGWQFTSCVNACTGGANNLFSFVLQPNYTTAGINDAQDGHDTYFYGGGPGVSPDGGNAYTADGAHEVGIMEQSISGLSVGQSYQLSFYQASMEQTGYTGAFTGNWEVGFGNQLAFSQNMSNPSQGYTGWTLQTMDFTATSVTQALLFAATATNSYPPFLLMDGVSLTAVPEPASIAVVGVGVLGLVMLRRRRRSAPCGVNVVV